MASTSAPHTASASPTAVRAGVATMLPLSLAYLPFGVVVGTAVAAHGAPAAGWAGSWLIYGGTAHLATLRTLDEGGLAAALLTGLLINCRLIAYSASLARRWPGQPRWFRIVAAGLIIDPTWAVADRYARTGPDAHHQRQHFLAAGLTLGVAWSGAVAAGVLLGNRLDAVDLEIVVPLCLMAIVGSSARDRGACRVVAAGAAVALVTRHWPAGTGTLAAIAAGCAAGRPPREGCQP